LLTGVAPRAPPVTAPRRAARSHPRGRSDVEGGGDSRRLCAAGVSLGLTGICHHPFRHTGATVMVAHDVSRRAVHGIGGWT
jgi:hypothetical protein